MSVKSCPKCGGRMAEGFTLDHTHGGYKQATWVDGAAEKSVWVGLKLKGRRQLPLASYRCERCGFVESYAEAR
jgi:predicted nucleic-acid-binding Zn-ribbon protein